MMMRCLPQIVGGSRHAINVYQQQQQQSSQSASTTQSTNNSSQNTSQSQSQSQQLQVPKVEVDATGQGHAVTMMTSPSAGAAATAVVPSPLMAHPGGGVGGAEDSADASGMPTLSPQPMNEKSVAAAGTAVGKPEVMNSAGVRAALFPAEQLQSGAVPQQQVLRPTVTAFGPDIKPDVVAQLKLEPGVIAVYNNDASSLDGDDKSAAAAEPTLYRTEEINTWLDAQKRSLTTDVATGAAPAAAKLKRPSLGMQLYETMSLSGDVGADTAAGVERRLYDFDTLNQW